ncbi:MAG: tRNA lysidine(34) synthetase TilS [Bacteroidales bacterium]|nr:tRNA lysidine(34) synthetase TilS [Bacteroidales bacterium]
MKNSVEAYIESQKLFTHNDHVLIGVSGGRDSVSLVYILQKLGYQLSLAHCNFKLRGKDADEDELFVRQLAKQLNIPFYNIAFETEAYANKNKISIQMAARELRYEWFEKKRKEISADVIAIAHNQDDVVETFFINLVRGTGIDGLTGIKAKNGNIVRPMLSISRVLINEFIQSNKIAYREDKSNASLKYLRNKLRHTIIPELRILNPKFDETIIENADRLSQVNSIYKQELEFKKSKVSIPLTDQLNFDIQKLKQLSPTATYLYEFIKNYGFSFSQSEDIVSSLDAESGKTFYSKTHWIVKDREYLILKNIDEKPETEVFFDLSKQTIDHPKHIKIDVIDAKDFIISTDSSEAALDFEKLQAPLNLRPWKAGDYFMPLGMNRMKKISDFLIDNKLSVLTKQDTYVVQSKNDIVWVVGMRIDDRYKISSETKKILILKYIK